MEKENTQRNAAFRDFLKKELERRVRSNPRVSLRSFAKSLEVQHSSLSQILSEKRPLTDKMCHKIARQLNLGPSKVRLLMSDKDLARANEESKFEVLENEVFSFVSEWHHYAILEMTKMKSFQGDKRWIAKQLGISQVQADMAIRRLKKLNLLEIDQGGIWIDKTGNTTNILRDDFTSSANRNLQRQILEKGITALEETPIELRSQTSMTVPVNLKNLKKAKSMIDKFRRDLDQLLKNGENCDGVYHLGISLYPVTKIN